MLVFRWWRERICVHATIRPSIILTDEKLLSWTISQCIAISSCIKIFAIFIPQVSTTIFMPRWRATDVPVGTGGFPLSMPIARSAQKLKVVGLYKVESAYCCYLSLIEQWIMDIWAMTVVCVKRHDATIDFLLLSLFLFRWRFFPKNYIFMIGYEWSLTKTTWFQHSFINT